MKDGFLDKLIARLDHFSPNEIQSLVSRLVREKGFMENVFESLREGVLILDPEGLVTFANAATHRLLGADTSKCIGQNVALIIRGVEWLSLANPTRVTSRDIEVFYPENRLLNFYLAPILGQVGDSEEHLGYVMLLRDVTASIKEREEIIESEKLNALTFLAAGVAHEIGNPLNSLGIHLQLLGRKIGKNNRLEASSKDELQGILATAQQEIKRLDNILKQFLNALRPQQPNREPASLHKILERTLQTLEAELIERNVKVSLSLADDLPFLELDSEQIQQAIYNILHNAAQAISNRSGCIWIESVFNENEVILKIRDNGSGISPEMMGALFEPYRTTKQSGTGLGLLIVRKILREHGGEIEIDSEEEQGTVISLCFPRFEKRMRMLEAVDSRGGLINIEA